MLLQTMPLSSLFSTGRSPLGRFVLDRPEMEEPQAAPEPSRPQSGVGGALSRLFGGDFDPRLSEEANARAGNRGLIASGLATLMSERPGIRGIAEGILVGQSVGQSVRDQQVKIAREEAARQKLADQQREVAGALAVGDIAAIRDVQAQLALDGRTDEAKAIGSVLGQLGVGAEAIEVDLNDGRTALINPVTSEVQAVYGTLDPVATEQIRLGDRVITHVKGEPDNVLSIDPIGVSPDKAAQLAWEREQEARKEALRASGVVTEEQSDLMDTLADDIRQDKKDSQFVADAARTLAGMPGNAASDLSLVMALTRITDPGATVRQSDVENATNIGGYSAQAQQWINRLHSQGEFSDEQRELLRNEAFRIARGRRDAWHEQMRKLRERAAVQGLPERAIETLVVDPFAGMSLNPDDPFEDMGG